MIIQGDCLQVMKTMEDNSISAIVTDPPYGLKFMGKDWDHCIPGSEFWKEALRISKPGSWLLAFGGSRTYHRLTCTIEDAGWGIRDCIMWIYGSGFPKSKGCLKPAYEPIIMARKKALNPKLNIDECRIPTSESFSNTNPNIRASNYMNGQGRTEVVHSNPLGRWPANVILDKESSELMGSASRFFYCAKASSKERNEGCQDLPDKIGGAKRSTVSGVTRTGQRTIQKNNHPTVKPLKLMQYLIKLVMPKEGVLLDPFAGSGTTILAAQGLGIQATGIELNPQYVDIARNRLKMPLMEYTNDPRYR